MSRRTPEDIVSRFYGTGSPPVMYLRLHEAISHPNSSLQMIGTIITEDASLSARLLRLVNSSFYGFPKKIATISEAVLLVGSRQVRDLAMATMMMKLFTGIPKEFVSTQAFWLHCLSVGVASKVIADELGEDELERYFVLGVMHDIGRLILYQTEADRMREALQKNRNERIPLCAAERSLFGFTHAEVGRALIEQWHLPASMLEVVRYHHQPELAAQYPLETAVIHTADVLVHALSLGSSGDLFVPPIVRAAWERMPFSAARIEPLMERIEREANDLAVLEPLDE